MLGAPRHTYELKIVRDGAELVVSLRTRALI
jgi:hypothetical protein